MGAPYKHAELSARRYGGKPKDYLPVHELLDSSKQAMSDIRHRALTHNSWFVTTILEKILGATIKNSNGKHIPVRDIAQWHIMEDFGGSFPSAQDYLAKLPLDDWMDNGKNGAVPPSHAKLPPYDQSQLIPPKRPRKRRKKNIQSLDLGVSGSRTTRFPRSDYDQRVSRHGCDGSGGRFD